MTRTDPPEPVRPGESPTRRDFLQAGSLACLGMGLPRPQATNPMTPVVGRDVSCILIFLVGGPSQLDTWDMKPDASESVRGPFRPIATRVPGVWVSELFPRLSTMTDRVSFVRTVHHSAAAVHDTGHQMMQTGRLFTAAREYPNYGSVVAKLKGGRGVSPPNVLLPAPIGPTGGNMPHGQSAGFLGAEFDPVVASSERAATREAMDLGSESRALRDRYGRNRFGQNCLQARRLVERGARFVTVNMYETVFNVTTWDVHGSAPFSALEDLRTEVGPAFDNGYATLLDDLALRGMLDDTMVLAFGEFGRTPRINPAGGRDHHPACWTVLFAGGPVRGGQVVGESDETGYAPKDRPVTTGEIAATVYHGLGLDPGTIIPGPDGESLRLVEPGANPIHELF